MQLEYVELPVGEIIGNSSSSGNLKLQVSKYRLDTLNISYYEAILICNKMSLADSLDTLYQYNGLAFVEDFFWLPNIKILENRSGYRLPTKEEWFFAKGNGEMEDIDDNIGEWIYEEKNAPYSIFELAPTFSRAVGLYRNPAYGMRVLRVN
jgi:hypothetical protein